MIIFSSRAVYFYCDSAKATDKGCEFEIKSYAPANQNLQDIARQLTEVNDGSAPWLKYFEDGLTKLSSQSESDFRQPSADTDKLYMSIGERDLIEVAHPVPQDDTIKRLVKGDFWISDGAKSDEERE